MDALLTTAATDDLDFTSSGEIRDRTSVGRAIECLRLCVRAHTNARRSTEARDIEETIEVLRERHSEACAFRSDALRTSPLRSWQTLRAWVGGMADAVKVSPREVRDHVEGLGDELLAIAEERNGRNALVERLRDQAEEAEPSALRAEACLPNASERLTRRIQQFLSDHGIRVLSCWDARRSPVSGGPPPILVHAFPYCSAPRTRVSAELQCVLAALRASPPGHFGDVYLFLLHIGGPLCSVPTRLELDHAAVWLVSVDVAEPRACGTAILRVEDLIGPSESAIQPHRVCIAPVSTRSPTRGGCESTPPPTSRIMTSTNVGGRPAACPDVEIVSNKKTTIR